MCAIPCIRVATSGESYGGNRRPAESNGSLPPAGWLKLTCGLTACTPGLAPGPTLGNEYGKTLPLLLPRDRPSVKEITPTGGVVVILD